jgi:hypothetical protein
MEFLGAGAEMSILNRRGNAFPVSRVCEILHADKKPPPEAR